MSTATTDTAVTDNAPLMLEPPAPDRSFAAALRAVEEDLSQLEVGEEESPRLASAIRETVESAGGVLLFQMTVDVRDETHLLAAAAFGEAEEREIAVIDLPAGGGHASVSPAQESELPIAAIASAYAGLAACWNKAA